MKQNKKKLQARATYVPRQPTPSIITHLDIHWSQFGPVTPGRHWHDPVTESQVTAPSDMQSHPATANHNTTHNDHNIFTVRSSDDSVVFSNVAKFCFFALNMLTHKLAHLAWRHFAQTCISTIARISLNFKVIGQRSRSEKWIFKYFTVARQ